MRILTDNAERAQTLLPEIVHFRRCALDDMAVDDRPLWAALGLDRPAWIASLPAGESLRFWSRLVIIDEAPRSQFDALGDLCRVDRCPHAAVACLALTGRRFHGHRDRPWVAARGNIHLSVAMGDPAPARRMLPGLTMLPAVATVAAVTRATDGVLRPGIKWVNDVLVDGRKIAGVLTSTQTQGDRLRAALLGIGLNVATSPAVVPTPFVPEVSCLADCLDGPTPRFDQLVFALLAELARGYDELRTAGAARLLDRYRAASLVVGQHVRIYDETFGERAVGSPWPAPVARGEVLGIEPDLTLRIAGREEAIHRGRLAFEAACKRFGV